MSDRSEVILAHYEAFFQGHEQALQTWNLGPITQVVPGFRIFRAMTWNRAATVLPIWLNVFEDNLRGRHVYEKVGDRRFGTSEHEGRPLLLYEKELWNPAGRPRGPGRHGDVTHSTSAPAYDRGAGINVGTMKMNEAEEDAGLPRTPGYRYAKRVGNQLFVAGQVPHDAAARIVGEDDPAAQATRCLDNLRTLLEVHHFAAADITHLTVYVVGPHANLVQAWGAVERWFPQAVPPATLLGVSLLGHAGQLVEVDATIVRDDGVRG